MPEFRKDPLTGSWVIIAPERAQRPIDANHRTAQVEEFAEWSEECPFCSGNELMTPPEVLAYRSPGTGSNQRGWTLRVVRNKYPALSPDLELNTVTGNDLHRSMVGFGYHEVIIETPSHSRDFSFMALDEIEDVLWAWRDRLLSIRADKRIKYALVFKNYGHRAGASLVHPHSQIIATPMVPKRIEEEVQNMRNYYGEKGACLLCAMLNTEKSEKKRICREMLAYAKDIYEFGMTYRGNSKGQSYYLPRDYLDELMWGSLWLYVATGEQKYMDNLEKLMVEKRIGDEAGNSFNDNWTQCWDYVLTGVFIKLATLTDKPLYKQIAEDHLDYWQNRISPLLEV